MIMQKKIPLIIDCDPGHDDAIALIIALASEKLDVLAVTTVAGNQVLDKVSDNARKIITFLGKKTPVAKGASKPLLKQLVTAGDVHGETGLDGPVLPDPSFNFENIPAWELQKKLIEESPIPVTIAAVGPLTNIAILLKSYPSIANNIEKICIMGGGLLHGNVTPLAEFNIYVDPEAAQIVFTSGLPIVLCPLDVTEKTNVTKAEVTILEQKGKRVGKFAAELMKFYSVYYEKLGYNGSQVHDACTIAYLIEPSMFTTEDLYVVVETEGVFTRGMTVCDRRPFLESHFKAEPENALLPNVKKPNVRVCLGLDRQAFLRLLQESCISYGE